MKKSKSNILIDISFLLALLFKFFNAGFNYFCVLDDYIQYGCYPTYEPLSKVFLGIGTVATRPFAALLDPTVWGSFFPNMATALLIISVIYFLSAKLFDKTLRLCEIRLTPFLYIAYLLLPLTFEATYWISASSRIVVGMFFTSLALYSLIQYIKEKKALALIVYIISSVLSFGFYESIAVFSGLTQALVILRFAFPKGHHRRNKKTLNLLLVPAICMIAILIYYKVGANFIDVSRVSSFSLDNMYSRIIVFLKQFVYIFTAGFFLTTVGGFLDGINILTSNALIGALLGTLIIGISFLCAYSSKKKCASMRIPHSLILGAVMTFAPLLPNLLVSDVWLTYRSIFVCLPGLLVLFSPLISILFYNGYARKIAVFIFVFVCLTASVSEVNTYKNVNQVDSFITNEIVNSLNEEVLNGEYPAVVVLPCEVQVPQPSPYKDHVKSVYCADWSATGAVRAAAKNTLIDIVPCLSLDDVDLDKMQVIYLDANFCVTEAK